MDKLFRNCLFKIDVSKATTEALALGLNKLEGIITMAKNTDIKKSTKICSNKEWKHQQNKKAQT